MHLIVSKNCTLTTDWYLIFGKTALVFIVVYVEYIRHITTYEGLKLASDSVRQAVMKFGNYL